MKMWFEFCILLLPCCILAISIKKNLNIHKGFQGYQAFKFDNFGLNVFYIIGLNVFYIIAPFEHWIFGKILQLLCYSVACDIEWCGSWKITIKQASTQVQNIDLNHWKDICITKRFLTYLIPYKFNNVISSL